MSDDPEETLIKRGDRGDHVARWQAFLVVQGFDPRGVDGVFGTRSSVATAHFHSALGLPPHGFVDRTSMRRAVELGYVGEIPFVAAKHFTPADRVRVDWIVFHTMEAPEKGSTAENVAAFFARGDVNASAHYNVDADSIVQSVPERVVAWHAAGANRYGIGVEHAGFARQTADEWADLYSSAMLARSAALVALLCVRWAIPPVLVDAAGLRSGLRGITTHKACTDAFSGGKGHWDPGPAWPGEAYVERVREAMGRAPVSRP